MLINNDRAYYNSSFDKRMLRYAKVASEREKRKKQRMIAITKYVLPAEKSLPSAEEVKKTNPDETAIKQNMALMSYEDNFSDSEDENKIIKNELGATASI